MRVKYVSIAISIVAISIVAISYHLQVKELFMVQSKDMLKSELAIQAELVSDKLKYNLTNLQKQFIEIGQTEGYQRLSSPQDGDKAMSSQLVESPFLGMALLSPDPTWTPMWVSLNSEVLNRWSKVFLTQLWGQLPYSRLDDVKSFWYKVPTKNSGFTWALIQKVQIPTTELPEKGDEIATKPAILVGFLDEAAFANLMSSIDSDENEIYVVDNYKHTLYHKDLNYLGETLPQYSSFDDQTPQELTKFTNSMGDEFVGIKKPISNTNLFLYYGVPAPSGLILSNQLIGLNIFIWALVVIALILFFTLYQNKSDKWLSNLKKLLKKWNSNKSLDTDSQDFEHVGGLESELKQLKSWIYESQQDVQSENYNLQQQLKSLKETSTVQDQNLLQSLKRPIMLSLGSLQVLKQKNKAFAQTDEFHQVEQTLRSLKERVDMSVNTDTNDSEFFLAEVLHECLKTQKDLTDRMGVKLEVHVSEKLSLTDVKTRWLAVLSQIMLELYDWVELSTSKTIQVNFMVDGDQPMLNFKLSNCGLNPVDIQSINERNYSELSHSTWKLICQSLQRMNLGLQIVSFSDQAEVKITIPSHKISNFALVDSVKTSEPTPEPKTEISEERDESSPKAEEILSQTPSQKTDIYEITEDDIDLDSFKVIPTQTPQQHQTPPQAPPASKQGEHDSFVSGTEIGQAPLFSDEELLEIKKQIEEAKKGKS